jgi:hypothetical protein
MEIIREMKDVVMKITVMKGITTDIEDSTGHVGK